MFLEIINPATEEKITEVRADTHETIWQKFEIAKKTLPKIKNQPLSERIKVIKKFQKLLKEKKDDLAVTLTQEMGKPISQSKVEISGLRERINFFLKFVENELETKPMRKLDSLEETISYEPLGVIVNISAWNYPYFVGGNVFIPAILTGNCVLYKPSEYATLTGQKITDLFQEASLEHGVFQSIYGAGDISSELLELPIDGIFFTGSFHTGKKISEKIVSKMIRMQFELGGKDPAYVHHDVDINQAAESLAEGSFYNSGQSCCAVERLYVHKDIYEKFVTAFVSVVKSYTLGDPMDEKTFIGPLSRGEQVNFLESQVGNALDKGAKLLLGGKRVERKGYFFEPTVITDTNHSMSLMKGESFGPVIGIQKVQDETEALHLMRDSEYGLTSAVYSQDRGVAEKILNEIDSGSVYWNVCDRVSSYLPWSGRRHSGFGATLSLEGIRTFLKPKAWHIRG